MDWFPGFLYRRKVTVSNPNNFELTNTPVPIKFPVSGVSLTPRRSDFRVTAADKVTPLPFFFETKRDAANHEWIWVKIPSIPAQGSTDIYVYSGNAAASSAESILSVATNYHNFANQNIGPFTNAMGGCSSVTVTGADSVVSGYSMELVDSSGSASCARYSAENTFFNATKKRFSTWLKIVSYSGSGDINLYLTYGSYFRGWAGVSQSGFFGTGGSIPHSPIVGKWFRIEVAIDLDAGTVLSHFWDEDGGHIGSLSGSAAYTSVPYRDVMIYCSLENVGTNRVGAVYAFPYQGGSLPQVTLGDQETNTEQGAAIPVAIIDASMVRSVGSVVNFVGDGVIRGTVKRLGVPARRRVTLLDRRSMRPVQAVWSDVNGNYRFDNVDRNFRYLVVCDDYAQEYNAAVADWVEPE